MANINLSGSIGTTGTSILGSITVTLTDANQVLSVSQYTNYFINVIGTLTNNRDIILPLVAGLTFIINNATTGGYAVRAIGATGSGYFINAGAVAIVVCDGTKYYNANTSAVVFDKGSPENLKAARNITPSPIDNTKNGIVNLASNNGGGGTGATNDFVTISGGDNHSASGLYSTISGGLTNSVSASYSTISGGRTNNVTGQYSTVCGGLSNSVLAATKSTITGGSNNIINGADSSFISNGISNILYGSYSAIFAGFGCTNSGTNCSIISGNQCLITSTSAVSTVLGYYTKAIRSGQFTTSSRGFFLNNGSRAGDSQYSIFVYNATTNNDALSYTFNDAQGSYFNVEPSTAYAMKLTVVACTSGGNDAAMFINDVLVSTDSLSAITIITNNSRFSSNSPGYGGVGVAISGTFLNISFTGKVGSIVNATLTIEITENHFI